MSNPTYSAPKGTRDLDGKEAEAFSHLEGIAREVFRLFGFSEVRTPLFEQADLFSRSLGETSDIVQKEMFTFIDRGDRTFALRPEGTAGVVRYFIENSLSAKGGIHRLFYMGPMFRAERPQSGRYRQFWQIGSEYFGPAEASADADTVLIVDKILRQFGLKNFSIQVNSLGCQECRPHHRKALLAYLKAKEKDLTDESRSRMKANPLRVLDSKVDGPKLENAPSMTDFLCQPCRSHDELFHSLMTASGISAQNNPRLVRGLDYYTRTVFEFVSPDLGAQSALAAGGRFDDLVELLGGPSTPGVGFALGMDRVVTAGRSDENSAPIKNAVSPMAVVIPLIDAAIQVASTTAQKIREKGISVPPIVSNRKLKNQLSKAVDGGARWVLLIGEDELKSSKVTLKNLITREQIQDNLNTIIGIMKK